MDWVFDIKQCALDASCASNKSESNPGVHSSKRKMEF